MYQYIAMKSKDTVATDVFREFFSKSTRKVMRHSTASMQK